MRNKVAMALVLTFVLFMFTNGDLLAQDYKECVKLLNYQKYNEALKCSQDLQAKESGWYYPVYLEAKAYRGLNQKDDAVSSLKEAAELASGEDETFSVLYEFTHLYYSSWANKSDRKEAEKYCVQAKGVASKPEFQAKIFSICGKIYFKTEDWSAAERDLRRAYNTDKNNAGIAELLIKTLMKRNKNKDAIDLLKKAPKNANTYAMFAEVLIKDGDFKEAAKNTDACLKLDLRNKKCMILDADANIGLKNWDDAIKILQRYTVMFPGDWRGNDKLGEVYLYDKKYMNALSYLKVAVENTPLKECMPLVHYAEAWENKYVHGGKKSVDLDNALTAITGAEKRCPSNSKMLAVKARIIERIKDRDRGDIEIDCDKQPNHPECKKLAEAEGK
ncbi:MAG: hypothetical protein JW737_01780 [Acidobacteria bacterium]|nr:hypothetical protein [Acidobacteriota bacterium]